MRVLVPYTKELVLGYESTDRWIELDDDFDDARGSKIKKNLIM